MYVPDELNKLGELYKERNALYKDNYKTFGHVVQAVMPEGITLETSDDFNRFALLVQIVGKITRYANMFTEGGHEDSLDDISVYAQMLKELDHDIKLG